MSTEGEKNVEKNKDLNKNIHLKIINFFISQNNYQKIKVNRNNM